ncbi:MAG: protein-glutamate O-methyltransferase CheR [Pseudomonadota bacterium]
MSYPDLSDRAFERIRRMLYDSVGITLGPAKKALVTGRLARRLRAHGLACFDGYVSLVESQAAEFQTMVDLLTTNETSFFREPRHFDFLRDSILRDHSRGRPFRVWSAASSTGEEPYSIAMTLAAHLGERASWEVVATDISTRVLEHGRRGVYAEEVRTRIPPDYLRAYCLKGVRGQAGALLMDRPLRERVDFRMLNLNGSWPDMGSFQVIFLRNVMIYFDAQTKHRLINRMADRLMPGGYLFIGHSETLNGLSDRFDAVRPAIYRLKDSGGQPRAALAMHDAGSSR